MIINSRNGGFGALLSTTKKSEAPRQPIPPRHGSSIPKKAAGRDLRSQYGFTFQASFAAALLLVVGLVRVPLQGDASFEITTAEQETVQMEEIQQTNQVEPPPAPPRPSVPIAVADETVLENDDLDLDASLDLDEPVANLPPPPPPKEDAPQEEAEPEIFVIVEQMPELIGGLGSIQSKIKYPEIAKKAGVEGRVFVQFVVDEQGNVVNPEVTRGIGAGCDEEAIRAVQQAKFKPGKQRGKAVRVKMSLPITFRLK